MGCLSKDGIDFGCCVCTPRFDEPDCPDRPVRSDVITYLYCNTNIAPTDPLSTDVRETGVQRSVQNTYRYAQPRHTSPNIYSLSTTTQRALEYTIPVAKAHPHLSKMAVPRI